MPRMPRALRTRLPLVRVPHGEGDTARGAGDTLAAGSGGLAFRRAVLSGLRPGGVACTKGDTPSKKNSKRVFARGGRVAVLPSLAHERWKEDNAWQLRGAGTAKPNIAAISVDLWQSTERLGDCTNKAESVLDLLVEAAIIPDDNWRIVPLVLVAYNGKDRENPRAEVTIFYA